MNGFFSILDYGASSAKKINTSEIQRAIDDCHGAGGGRVMFVPGVFVTGSLELKDNVELYLPAGCELKGSGSLDDYDDLIAPGFITENAPEKSARHLIRAVCAENISICGQGKINGSGLSFYSNEDISSGKIPSPPRPRLLMLYRCRNVRLKDTRYVDSPCWTIWLMKCDDVSISRLKIYGDGRLANNDGIHVDSCRNMTISGCILNTQDDCIVLRAIAVNEKEQDKPLYDHPGVCENITVSDCSLESRCQGIRVGCPGDSIIRKASFDNITIRGYNGIHFELPGRYLPGRSEGTADISDMVFSNFTINCSRFPVRVYIQEGIKVKRLSGLSFSGFRIKSGSPCVVQGSSGTQIRDVSFSDMDIKTSGEDAVLCRNCRDVRLENIRVSNIIRTCCRKK